MVPLQSLKDLFSSCQGHSLSQACLDGYPKGGTKLYPASLGRRSTRPCALALWVAPGPKICAYLVSRACRTARSMTVSLMGLAPERRYRTPIQQTPGRREVDDAATHHREVVPLHRTPFAIPSRRMLARMNGQFRPWRQQLLTPTGTESPLFRSHGSTVSGIAPVIHRSSVESRARRHEAFFGGVVRWL